VTVTGEGPRSVGTVTVGCGVRIIEEHGGVSTVPSTVLGPTFGGRTADAGVGSGTGFLGVERAL
jgi:hypothetical protein